MRGNQPMTECQECDVTTTLVLLSCVYVICEIPATIYPLYGLFITLDEQLQCDSLYNYIAVASDTLYIIKASVNFFVFYPCAAGNFRKALRRCVTCAKCSGKVHSQSQVAVSVVA